MPRYNTKPTENRKHSILKEGGLCPPPLFNILFMYSRWIWLKEGVRQKQNVMRKAPTPYHPPMNVSVDPAKEKRGSGPGAPKRPGSKGIPI